MAGKRQRFIEGFEALRLDRWCRPIHDRGRRGLVVLAYHRVMPIADPQAYPFDLDLISATPEDFTWQMDYIARECQPVSLGEVVDHLDAGRRLPERAVAVTFDDGFADTYAHAFPVLKQRRIPATVFVTTDYVDSGEPFWFELAAYLMMRVAPGAIRMEAESDGFPFGPSVADRRASIVRLHAILKAMPNERRTALIRDWSRTYTEGQDAMVSDLSRPLSWSQIREMARDGMAFGSHTLTHPNLVQLADSEVARELAESRVVLEARVEQPVLTVAYPIGTHAAYDDRIMAMAARSGYRLGLSYVPGANWDVARQRYELRRQGVGRGMSRSYFRALVNFPEWIS